MLVWQEKKPLKHAAIGLAMLGVAGSMYFFIPRLGPMTLIAAIVLTARGLQRLVTFATRARGKLRVNRDQESWTTHRRS